MMSMSGNQAKRPDQGGGLKKRTRSTATITTELPLRSNSTSVRRLRVDLAGQFIWRCKLDNALLKRCYLDKMGPTAMTLKYGELKQDRYRPRQIKAYATPGGAFVQLGLRKIHVLIFYSRVCFIGFMRPMAV